jgi:hypothetical protein
MTDLDAIFRAEWGTVVAALAWRRRLPHPAAHCPMCRSRSARFQYRRGLLSAHNRGLWLAAVPRARPGVDKRRLWADNETALVERWQRSYVGVHTTRRSG